MATMTRPGERGSASLSLVIVTVPFLAASFMTIHFLLIARADLVVKHAAARAVRTAVVVLDDREDRYGGEPRGAATGGRARAILEEARAPLLALAPSDGAFEGKSLGALLPDDEQRRALAAEWNEAAVAVSFPRGEGAAGYLGGFGANDDVTVRVTYLYPCALPLIDVGCRDLDELDLAPEEMPDVELLRRRFPDVKVWVFREEATLPNQGAAYEYGEGP